MKPEKILEQLLQEQKMQYKGGIYHITQIDLTYNSNRIEGSQLSKEHTRSLFETQTISASKDELIRADDVIEARNHFRAFDYILKNADQDLTEDNIKEIHKILKQGTSDSDLNWFNVGEYKALENTVGGHDTTPPNQVSNEIKVLLAGYNEPGQRTITDIIDFHVRFEQIHPFQDGNGRVGRLIMFKECLKNNIVPFIIDNEHKNFYYRGLDKYDKEKGYLVDTCLSAQDKYTTTCAKFVPGFMKRENGINKESRGV